MSTDIWTIGLQDVVNGEQAEIRVNSITEGQVCENLVQFGSRGLQFPPVRLEDLRNGRYPWYKTGERQPGICMSC